jgi:hypothetical protein
MKAGVRVLEDLWLEGEMALGVATTARQPLLHVVVSFRILLYQHATATRYVKTCFLPSHQNIQQIQIFFYSM